MKKSTLSRAVRATKTLAEALTPKRLIEKMKKRRTKDERKP